MKKNPAAENFIPFEPDLPPVPPDAGPRLKVMPKGASGETQPDFAPLQSPASAGGTKPGPNPTGPAASHSHPGPSAPAVTLQRDGDRITAIRVECACGQVIELACSY